MWIVFAIHYPLASLMADLCNELENAINGDYGGQTQKILDQIIHCENITAFVELRSLCNEALTASSQYGT
jgi:hypothetical protein